MLEKCSRTPLTQLTLSPHKLKLISLFLSSKFTLITLKIIPNILSHHAGVTELVFSYNHLKLKLGLFLTGYVIAMVT